MRHFVPPLLSMSKLFQNNRLSAHKTENNINISYWFYAIFQK